MNIKYTKLEAFINAHPSESFQFIATQLNRSVAGISRAAASLAKKNEAYKQACLAEVAQVINARGLSIDVPGDREPVIKPSIEGWSILVKGLYTERSYTLRRESDIRDGGGFPVKFSFLS